MSRGELATVANWFRFACCFNLNFLSMKLMQLTSCNLQKPNYI